MKRSMVLAIVLALVSMWVVLAGGIVPAWLPEELRAVGLVTAPMAIVASLLVLYFDWRAKLQRRILAEREDRRHLQKAA